MNTSLIINSTDTAGKAQQKTITYINPAVKNADLKTFAQMVANISSNSYVTASRVNKIDLDEDDSGDDSDSDSDLSDSDSDSGSDSDSDSDFGGDSGDIIFSDDSDDSVDSDSVDSDSDNSDSDDSDSDDSDSDNPSVKLTPTLSFYSEPDSGYGTITYDGDGTLSVSGSNTLHYDGNRTVTTDLVIPYGAAISNETSGVLSASEGSRYAAAQINITVYGKYGDPESPPFEPDSSDVPDEDIEPEP